MDSMDIDISEADFVHEEEILRNPHSVKCWLRYIEHKQDGLPEHLNMVYERALKQLPGSYKLWYKYLRERRRQCKEIFYISNFLKILWSLASSMMINQFVYMSNEHLNEY